MYRLGPDLIGLSVVGERTVGQDQYPFSDGMGPEAKRKISNTDPVFI